VADKQSDIVQGTLDMLILKTLALEPMHGYGIAVRLEQMSKGTFRINAGSYLSRYNGCNEKGWSKTSGNPPRTTGVRNITPSRSRTRTTQ